MKKVYIALMCVVLTIFFTACSRTNQNSPSTSNTETQVENSKADFQYEVSTSGEFVYINKYIGTSQDVVIPSQIDGLPVTSIKGVPDDSGHVREGAFEGCNVQSVTIPQTVTAIGLHAFKNCTELTQITVSKNLSVLLNGAFENCKKLEILDLSETKLQELPESAFSGCVSLEKVSLPSSLTKIQGNAFCDCSALTEIYLPENLVEIGPAAFVNCTSLKTITIPTKLELVALDAPAFSDVPKLETIVFQEGREEITGYAFFVTTSNVEIIIPKTVTKFSPETFFIHGPAKVVFEGDCPEIVANNDFYGEPTIFYNPNTAGWDTCVWKGHYSMEPKTT